MRRWWQFGGLALLAVICSSACAPTTQRVALPAAGLELDLPAAWLTQPAHDQTLLFARPAVDGVPVPGAYLMLVRHPQRPPGETPPLDSYAAFSEQQARQFAQEYALLRAEPATAAGQPARRHLRRWQGKARVKQELALLWVDQGYGYQLSATAPPESFARLRPQFERAAASLRRS